VKDLEQGKWIAQGRTFFVTEDGKILESVRVLHEHSRIERTFVFEVNPTHVSDPQGPRYV
jgi:hypothetical protein